MLFVAYATNWQVLHKLTIIKRSRAGLHLAIASCSECSVENGSAPFGGVELVFQTAIQGHKHA